MVIFRTNLNLATSCPDQLSLLLLAMSKISKMTGQWEAWLRHSHRPLRLLKLSATRNYKSCCLKNWYVSPVHHYRRKKCFIYVVLAGKQCYSICGCVMWADLEDIPATTQKYLVYAKKRCVICTWFCLFRAYFFYLQLKIFRRCCNKHTTGHRRD